MEIKDIMEQQIREIYRLSIIEKICAEKGMTCFKSVRDLKEEKLNMIIEWLTEDMTERELHDLYENNNFLEFWKAFCVRAQYSQELFIKELQGDDLNALYNALKKSDILQVAYNNFDKEIKTYTEPSTEEDQKPLICEEEI